MVCHGYRNKDVKDITTELELILKLKLVAKMYKREGSMKIPYKKKSEFECWIYWNRIISIIKFIECFWEISKFDQKRIMNATNPFLMIKMIKWQIKTDFFVDNLPNFSS